MSSLEKYQQFCRENAKLGWDEFLKKLICLFAVSENAAYNIWYAEQRSWFQPEMIDELIRLDKNPDEFQPPLCSGEFEWVNGKFVPSEE